MQDFEFPQKSDSLHMIVLWEEWGYRLKKHLFSINQLKMIDTLEIMYIIKTGYLRAKDSCDNMICKFGEVLAVEKQRSCKGGCS